MRKAAVILLVVLLSTIGQVWAQEKAQKEAELGPRLEIRKTDKSPEIVSPGDKIIYEISFWNEGNQTAYDITITDKILSSKYLRWDSVNSSPEWERVSDSLFVAHYPSLPPGMDPTNPWKLKFAVDVVTYQLPEGFTSLINFVEIKCERPFPQLDYCTRVHKVEKICTMAFTKTDYQQIVDPGITFTYHIGFQNRGNVPLSNIDLVDDIPNQTEYITASNNGRETPLGSRHIVWPRIDQLGINESKLISVTVHLPDYFPTFDNPILINTAYLRASCRPDTQDIYLVTYDTTYINFQRDLIINKQKSLTGEAFPNSQFQYTITVRNDGNLVTKNIAVTDTLTNYLIFISSTPDTAQALTDHGQRIYGWLFPELSPGADTTIIITVQVVSEEQFPELDIYDVRNCSYVSTPDQETVITNNSACDVCTVEARRDLSISKSDGGRTELKPEEKFQYTITYQNPYNKTGDVTVTDTLSPYLRFLSSNPSYDPTRSEPDKGVYCWHFEELPPRSSGQITLDVQVVPADFFPGPGTYELRNSASIATPAPEMDTTNNFAIDINTVNITISLDMEKTDNKEEAPPGDTLQYNILYANRGNLRTTNVVITDTLPQYTVFIDATSPPSYTKLSTPEGDTLIVWEPIDTLTTKTLGWDTLRIWVKVKSERELPGGTMNLVNRAHMASAEGYETRAEDITAVTSPIFECKLSVEPKVVDVGAQVKVHCEWNKPLEWGRVNFTPPNWTWEFVPDPSQNDTTYLYTARDKGIILVTFTARDAIRRRESSTLTQFEARPREFLKLDKNKFNPDQGAELGKVNITYSISRDKKATLRVYNIAGQLIRTLYDGYPGLGQHEISWDGKNDKGHVVASGVYLIYLESGDFVTYGKVIVLR